MNKLKVTRSTLKNGIISKYPYLVTAKSTKVKWVEFSAAKMYDVSMQ